MEVGLVSRDICALGMFWWWGGGGFFFFLFFFIKVETLIVG
jgi:hypothetical protein